VLALDFDGVVCDALRECAAVSWYAGRPQLRADVGPDEAARLVPRDFLTTFGSVRAYSRTLADFMVANAVAPGTVVDRATFDRRRKDVGQAQLDAQALRGETIRARWRTSHPGSWLRLHRVHDEVTDLLRSTSEPVVIVSAKDAESIAAILPAARLDGHVSSIVGSCTDKAAALAQLAADAWPERLVFVDDNLDNALAASRLAGVESRWAYWGYHGPEDDRAAASAGIDPFSLDDLSQLGVSPAPAASH
jgi:FMN phosphatase YigB (HAD superfamily)